MDFQSNKINQPFNPSSNYFQGLSNNIQNRVGIEVKNVVEVKTPKIEFNKKQKPIQLTVEFGFPLTAEKNANTEITENNISNKADTIQTPNNLVKDDEIGQIHIEPIQLAANPNPYWHNFNSDDELEGLVLDSEGQEMSDITINGDAMFDIDQHFLQSSKSETEVAAIPENSIDIESIEQVSTLSEVVIEQETHIIDTLPVVNDIEINKNDISSVVNEIDNEETFFSFSFTPESSIETEVVDLTNVAPVFNEIDVIDVATNINEIETIQVAPITNEIEAIEVAPNIVELVAEENLEIITNVIEHTSVTENNEAIEYSFSDADLDNLHEQMSQQLETKQPEKSVDKKNQAIEPVITFVEFTSNEVSIDPEREYTDAELDLLHEQLSKEIEASKPRVSEPIASINNSPISNSKVDAVPSIADPIIETKTPILEMIPWSSVFGIVASLMAVASAWFIWNSIQKPIAIDEFIDSKIAPIVNEVKQPTPAENIDNTLSLAPSDFIANEILLEVDNPSNTVNEFNFKNLSEQSKIGAVFLESNGLTTLELEDGFFEDLGI